MLPVKRLYKTRHYKIAEILFLKHASKNYSNPVAPSISNHDHLNFLYRLLWVIGSPETISDDRS